MPAATDRSAPTLACVYSLHLWRRVVVARNSDSATVPTRYRNTELQQAHGNTLQRCGFSYHTTPSWSRSSQVMTSRSPSPSRSSVCTRSYFRAFEPPSVCHSNHPASRHPHHARCCRWCDAATACQERSRLVWKAVLRPRSVSKRPSGRSVVYAWAWENDSGRDDFHGKACGSRKVASNTIQARLAIPER